MKFRIKHSDLLMAMACLLLVNNPYVSQTLDNIFTLCIEVLLIFLINCVSFNVIKNNKAIVIFALVMLICTILNFGLSTRTANAIVTGLKYILLFYSVYYYLYKRTIYDAVAIVIQFLGIMIVLADLVVVIVLLTQGVSIHGGVNNTYIIGNKFVVSYYHMFFLALYKIEGKKWLLQDKLKFVLLAVMSIGICYFVQCNTGVIGCSVVILVRILSIKKNAITEILSKEWVFCVVWIVANFVLVGTDFLLKKNFITDLLLKYSHTSKILTGRTEMFVIALREFSKSPIIGHGINCTVVEDMLTYGNAQNGLLKILLDYGILGIIAFFVLCFETLRRKNKHVLNKSISYGILAFLYGMLVCSLVEINLNSLFIMALALYNAVTKKE